MMMATRKWEIQLKIEVVGHVDELGTIYSMTAIVDDICMSDS